MAQSPLRTPSQSGKGAGSTHVLFHHPPKQGGGTYNYRCASGISNQWCFGFIVSPGGTLAEVTVSPVDD